MEREIFKDKNLTIKEKQGAIPLFNRVHLIRTEENDLIWLTFPFFQQHEDENLVGWFLSQRLLLSMHKKFKDTPNQIFVSLVFTTDGERAKILPVILVDEEENYRFYKPVVELVSGSYSMEELENLVNEEGVDVDEMIKTS
ncbi:hypothetical protein [Persephonella sp.]